MTTKTYNFTAANGIKLSTLYPSDFTVVPGFLGTADFEVQNNKLSIASGGGLVSNSSAKTDQSVSIRPHTVNGEVVVKLRAATSGDAYTATILFNGAVGIGRNGTTIQNFFGVFSNNGSGANLITFEATLTPTGVELVLKKDGVTLLFDPAAGIVAGRYIDPSPIAVNDIKFSFETGSVVDDLTIAYAASLLQVPAQPTPGAISAVTTSGFTAAWAHGVGGAIRAGYEARYRYKANTAATWSDYTNLTALSASATSAIVASDANLNGQLIAFEVRSVAAGPEYSDWTQWGEFWAVNGSNFGGGTLPTGGGGTSTVTGVTISPASISIATGATQQFSATVQGANSPSQAVTWSAPIGGSADPSGIYTAPGTPGNAYTMRATSVQDPSVFAEATITVTQPLVGIPSTITGPLSPTFGKLVVYTVRDAADNLLQGVMLRSSAGTFLGPTNASGQATLSVGPRAGTFTVETV
jgi:Bacterial Ig-like domain (group 2)